MPNFKYNFLTIEGEELKVGVYSPYFENCLPQYMEYQLKVFEKLNVNLNQCLHTKTCPQTNMVRHGEFLNEISRSEEVDYLVFFDVDAIPLKENFLEILIKRIHGKKAILGIEQKSNHVDVDNAKKWGGFNSKQFSELKSTKQCYAGPACFVISKDTYQYLGEPSYNETFRSDCGEELSWIARDKGVEVQYIKFTSCEIPMWPLREGVKFGIASDYEDLVFHNFQARLSDTDLLVKNPRVNYFINKCETVLNNDVKVLTRN